MKLLGYAKTRFLALGPAVGRILKLFGGLKAYFESLPGQSEAVLKAFFREPKSKFWLLFIKDQVINKYCAFIFYRLTLITILH